MNVTRAGLGLGWLVVVAAPAVVTAHGSLLIQPASRPGWLAAAVTATVFAALRAGDHQRGTDWN